ncbi:hypothetical protein ACLMJK_005631 [Lecanora helva]
MYKFAPVINSHQQAILIEAFSDAIFLALNALNPPSTIPISQQRSIFDKYFPLQSKSAVDSVFESIVGGNVHTGNAAFAHLLVTVTDSNNLCSGEGVEKYMSRSDLTIVVCSPFWTAFGKVREKTCADISENIMSWPMSTSGDVVLNMLIGLIGSRSFGNNASEIFNAQSEFTYTGPASAFYTRSKFPDTAIHSVANYDWYALINDIPDQRTSRFYVSTKSATLSHVKNPKLQLRQFCDVLHGWIAS